MQPARPAPLPQLPRHAHEAGYKSPHRIPHPWSRPSASPRPRLLPARAPARDRDLRLTVCACGGQMHLELRDSVRPHARGCRTAFARRISAMWRPITTFMSASPRSPISASIYSRSERVSARPCASIPLLPAAHVTSPDPGGQPSRLTACVVAIPGHPVLPPGGHIPICDIWS